MHWALGGDVLDPPRPARTELIVAKVAELVELGATRVREEEYADDEGRTVLGHVVMLDPEGDESCVA